MLGLGYPSHMLSLYRQKLVEAAACQGFPRISSEALNALFGDPSQLNQFDPCRVPSVTLSLAEHMKCRLYSTLGIWKCLHSSAHVLVDDSISRFLCCEPALSRCLDPASVLPAGFDGPR